MLTAENTCLIVIDVQEKLLPVMFDSDRVLKNCSVLIRIAQTLNIPIFWCQQAPQSLGPTVAELAQLLASLAPVNKTAFSCCGAPAFLDKLSGSAPQTAILCGIETHVCVFQTAIDLIQRGLHIHVIADAVSSRTSENKQAALTRMHDAGVVISTVEMLLFELLRDAAHPHFKTLARLIK